MGRSKRKKTRKPKLRGGGGSVKNKREEKIERVKGQRKRNQFATKKQAFTRTSGSIFGLKRKEKIETPREKRLRPCAPLNSFGGPQQRRV